MAWELRHRTPNSYEQVIELIQGFSELNVQAKVNVVETDDVASLRKEVTSQAALIEQLLATQMEMQKQLTAALAQNNSRRAGNKGPITCYRCQKQGHIAKNCTEGPTKEQTKNVNVQ